MATDVRCVENLASLSEVKGLKSRSRVAGRGQCGVLKTSTATEIMVHRESMRIAPYLGPDRFHLLFTTKELARDVQTLSMFFKRFLVGHVQKLVDLMLKFVRGHFYLFCYSWFRLQSMAIHCDRRSVCTDTPHT